MRVKHIIIDSSILISSKNIFKVLFLFIIGVHCQVKAQQSNKPNIIYIMADDLGYGDLGVYGQQKIKTPNLDRFAKQGIRFTQHYAGSTVCGPSRASLLTGKHMGHALVRGNPRWTSTGKPVDIPAEEITVAEELKRAGYTTAIIGKWGLAEAGLESMPLSQGFDYFYGFRKHKTAHHYYPDILWENNDPFHPKGNDWMNKKGQYSHDSLTSKAVQFIENNRETSFFLYLAYTIPHYELTVPEESKTQYKDLGWQKRQMKQAHYRHDEEGHSTYAGMVSRMDRDIGTIIDLLDKNGLAENTLVIFTSDNGHEFDKNFFDSNGKLRGKKRDLYEGGIRVPFIAKWQGTIQAGRTTEHIAAFWDFLPTACEIAGIKPSANTDGISYLPTLKNTQQETHEYLYWEFNEGKGPIQAIRKGDWKAVKYFKKPMELYNLVNDISEEKDLAKYESRKVAEFEVLFSKARIENENFPLKPHARIAYKFE